MRFRWLWPWAALSLLALSPLFTIPAWGQQRAARVLTLEEALALARERGGTVVLARGRIEEARARQAQAGRRFQENPVLEVDGGYRRAEEGFFDFEAAVTQGLYAGTGGPPGWRAPGPRLDRAEAELAEARRLLLREVWTASSAAWWRGTGSPCSRRAAQAADELLGATERRYEAGEITALELNRARTAAAIARAGQSAAEAEADVARARGSAGAARPGSRRGRRGPRRSRPSISPPALDALLAGLDRRPDLRALAAELREAEAEVLLGQALARPELGVRGGVAREEGADIVTAGVVIALPVHNRGQETLAVGQARAAALRQALAAARSAAEAEVRGASSALDRRLAAVRELERTALPALDDNESLALKSFEAGEIGLGELLLIRREILETRLAYLDRLLEAALTRFELETAAGALQ